MSLLCSKQLPYPIQDAAVDSRSLESRVSHLIAMLEYSIKILLPNPVSHSIILYSKRGL